MIAVCVQWVIVTTVLLCSPVFPLAVSCSTSFGNPLHLPDRLAGFRRRASSGDCCSTTCLTPLHLLNSLPHECPPVDLGSIPTSNDSRSIPIPLHIDAMKQNLLRPAARQCRFVRIKPFEWRGRNTWCIQQQQRLECILIGYEAADEGRKLVCEKEGRLFG